MVDNKNNYCTFYLVRHGETEWNQQRILQGQKDSLLTDKGVKQARKLISFFQNIKFDQVYSSDLIRAEKTAQIMAMEKNIAVNTTKLLRERCFADYEGKSYQILREKLKDQIKLRDKLSQEQRFKFRLAKGIETDEEVMSRFITFLRQKALVYPNKKILIVTHGGVMRTFLVHLGFAKHSQLPPGSIKNTGYIMVDSDGVDFFIKQTFGIKLKN